MLEQKQKSKQFQKVLSNFSENAGKGIVSLQEFAFKEYKKEGKVPSFNGFFTIQEDKLVFFSANKTAGVIPPEMLGNPNIMDKLLKGFKDFLEKLGHNIMGFISIQQVWMRKVHIEEEVSMEEDITEAIDKKDCLMFLMDTADYSLTLIYEKIVSGEDYVISPEPIEELYINKKDPNYPVKLEKGIYNFF